MSAIETKINEEKNQVEAVRSPRKLAEKRRSKR